MSVVVGTCEALPFSSHGLSGWRPIYVSPSPFQYQPSDVCSFHGNPREALSVCDWPPVLWISVLVSQSLVVAAEPAGNSCETCHLALGVENLTKPAENFKSDIHAAKGFGCASCHGGDPTIMGMEAMDKKKGYIGKPVGLQIIEACGKCHADANLLDGSIRPYSRSGRRSTSHQFTARGSKSKKIRKSRPAPVAMWRIRSGRRTIRVHRFIH